MPSVLHNMDLPGRVDGFPAVSVATTAKVHTSLLADWQETVHCLSPYGSSTVTVLNACVPTHERGY